MNQDNTWYQDARQAFHGNDLVGADGQLAKLDWSIAYTQFQWVNHTANNPGVPFTPDHEVYPYDNGLLLVSFSGLAEGRPYQFRRSTDLGSFQEVVDSEVLAEETVTFSDEEPPERSGGFFERSS